MIIDWTQDPIVKLLHKPVAAVRDDGVTVQAAVAEYDGKSGPIELPDELRKALADMPGPGPVNQRVRVRQCKNGGFVVRYANDGEAFPDWLDHTKAGNPDAAVDAKSSPIALDKLTVDAVRDGVFVDVDPKQRARENGIPIGFSKEVS